MGVTSSTKADRRSHGGRGPRFIYSCPLFALFSPLLDPTDRPPPPVLLLQLALAAAEQRALHCGLSTQSCSSPLLQSEDTTIFLELAGCAWRDCCRCCCRSIPAGSLRRLT